MQFIFKFSLPHSNRRIAIWCCWLQNCYKVLSKSTIFSIFFSPLNPCQSLQIGCSWSQKVSVSRRRVTTKICNNLSHYFLQISLKIRRKKHCETNFFFSSPQASGQRGGGGEFGARWKPTKPFDHHSNQQMAKRIQLMNELDFFFLTKAPKTFLRKPTTVRLPLLPADGQGNPNDESNPLFRRNPKTFVCKYQQNFLIARSLEVRYIVVNNSTISVDILKSRPSVGSLGPISLGLSLPLLAIQWPAQLMGCDGKGFLDILVSPPAFPCVLHIDCVRSSF